MITKRTAAVWRAFGQPVLAGLLVLFLFVSALASASPSLHHWLHADHQTPSHYCLVTVLEHGQTEVADVAVTVAPVASALPVAALPGESFFISHDLSLHPERGPPIAS
jgi:hypothetical protein